MSLKTDSTENVRSVESAAPIPKEQRIGIIFRFSSTVAAQSNFVWDTETTYCTMLLSLFIDLLMPRHGPDTLDLSSKNARLQTTNPPDLLYNWNC